MQVIHTTNNLYRNANPSWCDTVFAAKAARSGGIVRRALRDVEREVGRQAFIAEVSRRHFHLIECADQFIVICRDDDLRVLV